jgi:hypothetical protein
MDPAYETVYQVLDIFHSRAIDVSSKGNVVVRNSPSLRTRNDSVVYSHRSSPNQ